MSNEEFFKQYAGKYRLIKMVIGGRAGVTALLLEVL